MVKVRTFSSWKKIASKVALDLLGISDLFAEGDPYSIHDMALDMYATNKTSEEFVRKAFEEDLRLQKQEALETGTDFVACDFPPEVT